MSATYLLILCLVCGSGSTTQNYVQENRAACEAEAQRFRAIPGTIAECLRQYDAREADLRTTLQSYCKTVVDWRPPPAVAGFYADLPKTMDECMARYTPREEGS